MPISPELLKKVGGVVVKPNTGAVQPSPKPPAPSNGASLDLNKLNLNDGSLSVISAPKKQLDGKDPVDLEKAKTGLKPYEPKKDPTIPQRLDVALNISKPSTANTEMSRLLLSTLPETASNLKDTAVAFGKTLKTQIQNFDINEKRDISNPKGNILFTKLLTEELENDNNWIDGTLKAFQKYNDENVIKPMEEELESRKKEFNIKDDDLIQDLAAALPSGLAFAGTAIGTGGVGALTKMAGLAKTAKGIEIGGRVLAFVTEAGMEATSVRNQILGDGGTEEEAAEGYVATLGLNAIAIGLTNKWSGIFDMTSTQGVKGFMKAVATATGFEGLQEGLQQVIANVNTGRPIWDGVDRAVLVGAIFGGTLKGTTSVGANLGSQFFRVFKPNATPAENKEIIENFIEENKALIPADQIEKAEELLEGANEQRTEEIMSETLTSGQVEQFTEVINQVKSEQQALEEELLGVYEQQVAAGISPTVIYQELSDRTGIPVEDIKSTIQELETRPKEADPISQIAEQLLGQKLPEQTAPATEEDQLKSLAEQTLQQDEATAPNVVKDMENDAEMQADWERNYKVEYGDYNRQEVALRGLEQRYTQRAAKARVQGEIARIEGKKRALQEEYKKNNTEVTKADVEKAQKEKNPKKANRVLNQVGKEKTTKVVKNGKGVVRVNRITDTKKVTKKQLEKRAKAEGSFLDMKIEPTTFDKMSGETVDIINDENLFTNLATSVTSNPFETTISKDGVDYIFRTDEYQEFMEGRDIEEIRFYMDGNQIFLIDSSYGDWNRNSIVGRIQYFEPQKSTLFQTSSRNRFATQKDIENAFNNIPFLKYVPVQRVSEIKTPGGGSAWGSYFEGLIKYTENPKYGTIPHEAFHAFVDLILTPQERANLFDLAKIEMRKDGYASDMTNIQIEEYLAERFEDYYITKTEKSAFKQWFDKIIQALKSLVQSKKTINDYYNSVFDYETGQMLKPNNEMMPIRGDFVVAMNPESIEEAREIVDGAEISQAEKNFLMNILDNPAYAKKTDWEAFLEEVGVRTLQVEGKIQNGRVALIERGNEEIGLPENTSGFAYLIKTDVEHGANTSHGFTDGADSIGWANVANADGYYQVKEIQKISNRILEPELENSNATPKQKEEVLALNKNYMNAFVIGLRDMAANDFKVIKFPTVEKARLVNPQMSEEVAEKVYGKELSLALEKFTEAQFEDDGFGGNWVVYPSNGAKMIAQRFQTADVFEAIQQEHLTTKILNRLGDRKTVSKTFVSDLAKMPDVKVKEKEIITDVLKGESETINVEEFKQKVRAELLPLSVKSSGYIDITMKDGQPFGTLKGEFRPGYERISLPYNLKGNVKSYREHIYESPIKTSAGNIHFGSKTDSYFGHTRIEDMKGEETRRVIEVQSDLYQKGMLEKEVVNRGVFEFNGERYYSSPENERRKIPLIFAKGQDGRWTERIQNPSQELIAKAQTLKEDGQKRTIPLQQYSNPTAHFRMVREEIKKAAQDGKSKLQFPTGETAMKIEGLGQTDTFTRPDFSLDLADRKVTPENIKIGEEIIHSGHGNDKWIVTDILGDGKFKATPKRSYKIFLQLHEERLRGENSASSEAMKETFDISGKTDTDNPIYKFYQETLDKYLKNTFQAKLVTDSQGVTWFEVEIKPEMAGRVEAFQQKTEEDMLMEEARKYKSAEEFVKAQLDKHTTTLKNDLKVYRGEGGGIGNTTLVNGKYFADSEKFAKTFGNVTEHTIPEGTKIFDLDVFKKQNNGIVSDQTLVDPTKLTDFLIDNGYEYTKNTNTRGIEYVKLARTLESKGIRTPIETFQRFDEKFRDLADKYSTFEAFYKAISKRADDIWKETGKYFATNQTMSKEYFNNVKNGTIPKNTLGKETTLEDLYNKVNKTKFQEKDTYDRMGELLLKIKGDAARTMKKETLIERIAKEIDDDLKGGFYTPQIIRQELAKAAALYEQNPELAINIAKGLEDGPDNINYLALGRYALYQVTQQGRAEDQIDIINNISKEARKAGQSISMLSGLLTIDSPNQFINQLQSFKNDLAKKNFKALFTRSKSVVIEDLVTDEVRKTKRKKSTKDLKEKLLKEKEFELDSFLNALAC